MGTPLFEFYCPVKIISGDLALANVPHEMEQLGTKRALIVTDKGVAGAGLIKYVEMAFEGSGCEIGAIFDETPPDSSNRIVNKVAELFKEKKCDCFVAVGGGSCMDTTKGANIVVSEGTDDLMKFQGADRISRQLKPFMAVPTTAGTGSEVTLVAVIYNEDKNCKMAFTSDRLLPNAAFLDPRMTMSLPPKITAATGMDALTHAVEAYFCLQKNPVSDAFAISAIKLIMANIEKATEKGDDVTARLNMANGALLAGIAFSNSMVGVVHSLAHATGGVCHVPHGVANSIFLPYGMEQNLEKCSATIAELSPLLCKTPPSGGSVEKAKCCIQSIRDLADRLNKLCGLPTRLRDTGVKETDLPEIAKLTINDGSLVYNPEELTFDEALEILKKAF
ncbi:MAG TPA: iron-containing alcohol dehydrogenase [bacterium]|nr:iron-containing alcohol dehydrogenase [bacterium]